LILLISASIDHGLQRGFRAKKALLTAIHPSFFATFLFFAMKRLAHQI